VEYGLEFGILNDRLGFEGSIYQQETADAIVQKLNPPSSGFTTAKSVNIGAIQNHGWEASVNFQAFSSPKYDWMINLRADGNKNEITDLGGVNLGNNNQRLGYPIGGVWDRKATGFSVKTTGTDPTLGDCSKLTYGCPITTRSDTAVYFGNGLPTNNFGIGNTFRAGPFSFYALVSVERGAWFSNGDRAYRIRQGGSDEWLAALGPNGDRTFKSDSIKQYASILNYVDKRDNVRLRELSIAYNVPQRLSGSVGAGATSITLSGQNVWWWDDCNCVDPNMNWAGASSFNFNSGFLMQPAPRVFRMQVRTRF
jgi:TonB-dependent starch-binding outer membrane protein SusC